MDCSLSSLYLSTFNADSVTNMYGILMYVIVLVHLAYSH